MDDDASSSSGGQRKSAMSDTEKRQEYLVLLQERNRLKKMMTMKRGVELENEEKEKGFSTHFRGANAQKGSDNPHRTNKRQSRKAAFLPNAPMQKEIESGQEQIEAAAGTVTVPSRKGWNLGRPKFLFGVRLENQTGFPSTLDQIQSPTDVVRRSKMSLEDESLDGEGEENEEEDYGDYVEDFEDSGGDDALDEYHANENERDTADNSSATLLSLKSTSARPDSNYTGQQRLHQIGRAHV